MKSRSIAVTVAFVLAVAATAAIYLYVQGVRRSATRATTNMITVIVPKEDIPAQTNLGKLISSGGFTTLRIPTNAVVQGAVTDLGQLKGKTTGYPILQGEQISVARLQGSALQPPGGRFGLHPGYEAVTIPLALPQALSGVLQANDHVTIYASFDDATVVSWNLKQVLAGTDSIRRADLGHLTITVAPDVKILRVDAPATGGLGSGTSGTIRITFELQPSDAANVIEANSQGSVWLALLPPNQKGEAIPPTNIRTILTAAERRTL